MRGTPWIALALAACLVLGACGGGDPAANGGPGGGDGAAEPTKEQLVQTLRDLLAAIEAKRYDDAAAYLVPLPGMKPEEIPEALQSFVDRGELSGPGIDILVKEGAFGEMDDLFGERGWSWAKRAGVEHNECWALTFDDAEVAAHWNGEAFRLIRLDDVGKLK